MNTNFVENLIKIGRDLDEVENQNHITVNEGDIVRTDHNGTINYYLVNSILPMTSPKNNNTVEVELYAAIENGVHSLSTFEGSKIGNNSAIILPASDKEIKKLKQSAYTTTKILKNMSMVVIERSELPEGTKFSYTSY